MENTTPIETPQTPPTGIAPVPAPKPKKIHKTLIAGFIVTIIVVILGLLAAYFFFAKNKPQEVQECSPETKICPDGTSVGKSWPSCKFLACPAPEPKKVSTTLSETKSPSILNWKLFTNKTTKYSIEYPNKLTFDCSNDFLCIFKSMSADPINTNYFLIGNVTNNPDWDATTKAIIINEFDTPVGAKLTSTDPGGKAITYDSLPDVQIGKFNGKVLLNKEADGRIHKKILVTNGANVYLIDAYVGNSNISEEEFNKALLTLKLN